MAEKNDIVNPLDGYDKLFESRVRLEIMSVLSVNDEYEYTGLKSLLGLTDGNLTSHLRSLESAGYITYRKQFIGRKPNTVYMATDLGLDAFKNHLNALESLYKSINGNNRK